MEKPIFCKKKKCGDLGTKTQKANNVCEINNANCEQTSDNVNICGKKIRLGIQAKRIVLVIVFFYFILIMVFGKRLQEYYRLK